MASFVAALALAALVPNALAQSGADLTPLASKRFEYTALVRRLFSLVAPPFAYLLPPSSPTRPTRALVNVAHSKATTSATRLSVFYPLVATRPIFSFLSQTAGPNSLCQTAIINSIDDFCLWGPTKPNSEIGVIEGEVCLFLLILFAQAYPSSLPFIRPSPGAPSPTMVPVLSLRAP